MKKRGPLLKMLNVFSTFEKFLLLGALKHVKFPAFFPCIYCYVATLNYLLF